MDSLETKDSLTQKQVTRCKRAIEMAMASYSPGEEKCSSSGVPYFLYGEYMWIYIGFTPCEFARLLLEEEYHAIFGKIIPVEPAAKQSSVHKDLGFAYGTPFVGIPLPR